MNKEEFQTKKNDINSKIRKLKSQKIKLDNYESVVIPEKKQYAYIKGYNIGFYDTIDPLFSKVKKDGTMSDVNLYVNLTNTTIELVKE